MPEKQRLREWLFGDDALDTVAAAILDTEPTVTTLGIPAQAAAETVLGVLEDRFDTAPSDSQGDQERCGGSGQVAYQDADETHSFRPCPGHKSADRRRAAS